MIPPASSVAPWRYRRDARDDSIDPRFAQARSVSRSPCRRAAASGSVRKMPRCCRALSESNRSAGVVIGGSRVCRNRRAAGASAAAAPRDQRRRLRRDTDGGIGTGVPSAAVQKRGIPRCSPIFTQRVGSSVVGREVPWLAAAWGTGQCRLAASSPRSSTGASRGEHHGCHGVLLEQLLPRGERQCVVPAAYRRIRRRCRKVPDETRECLEFPASDRDLVARGKRQRSGLVPSRPATRTFRRQVAKHAAAPSCRRSTEIERAAAAVGASAPDLRVGADRQAFQLM
jgi:hypothetical protein